MEIEQENKINQNLYSRQIGAFGMEAMQKLVKQKVLILGVSGVGLESAKNLILAGPKQVTIWDPRPCQKEDIEFNYYLNEEEVNKKSKQDQIVPHLQQLNPYVNVNTLNCPSLDQLLQEDLSQFDVVQVSDWFNLNKIQQLNDKLRQNNQGMVISLTAGMLGFVLTDFVNHTIFDKNGEPKKHVLIGGINDNIVYSEEDKRHNLEEGDLVKFDEIVGMESLNGKVLKVQKVLSPYSLDFGDLSQFGQYIRNGFLEQVKKQIQMSFKSVKEVFEQPLTDMVDCDMDFMNMNKQNQYKVLIKTLWNYIDQFGIPSFFDCENKFMEMFKNDIQNEIDKFDNKEDMGKEMSKIFDSNIPQLVFGLCKGTYSPVCSYFGGISAQEVIKKTGKFTPINNIFIHEFYTGCFKKVDYEKIRKNKQCVDNNKNSRYLSHYALLGEEIFNRFRKANVLLVGSGALGCEYMKMFSISGLSCHKEGKLKVVDDDVIELSNLNRQFLFRQHHLKQSKSVTSCQVTKQFNKEYNCEPIECRLQPSTENLFTDEYWDSLNIVVNAVDNIKARKYVDSKCVIHMKPLFESGTLGTKCNSQLILPNKTECYSDSQDPPEKHFPECTMRSFPFLIVHCIEYARSKFFKIFVKCSQMFSEFQKNSENAENQIKKQIKSDLPDLIEQIPFLRNCFKLIKNPCMEQYIRFSVELYQYFFDQQIAQLVQTFPPDYVDKNGKLFWTSPKRPPVAIPFDKNNDKHVEFVLVTMKILNSMFPISFSCNDESIKQFLQKMKITRKKVQKGNKSDLLKKTKEADPRDEQVILDFIKEFKQVISNTNIQFNELEFEKDDDENGHIDFITFFSNFRAENYSIPVATRHKIKMIAGKIIPAIATSTASVCGAIGVEIYKYFLDVPFDQTRNYFCNLAIPIFSFSEPFPPLVQKDKEYDVILMGPVKTIPKNWNTWSRIDVKGPCTLQQMIDKVYEEYKFKISSITCLNMQVWTTYTPKDNFRLSLPINEMLEGLGRKNYNGKKYEIFQIAGENDEMEDIVSPYVKYHL